MTLQDLVPERLTDPSFHAYGNVYALWHWMRENAPVYWHDPGEYPGFWSVTCYEDIRSIFRNTDAFSSENGVLLRPQKSGDDPGSGLTLALSDPPRHMLLRNILADLFTDTTVRMREARIRESIRTLMRNAAKLDTCDFLHSVCHPLSIDLIFEIIGVPRKDREIVGRWATSSFEKGTSLATNGAFMSYIIELMEQRMVQAKNDVMSRLIHGNQNDILLSDEEILMNCENIVGAVENAGVSMASATLALMRNPIQWQKLHLNPAMLDSAVEELLRWTSTATHSMRTVRIPIEIRGNHFRKGDRVVLWIPSANRDSKIFSDPEQLDITRCPNRHLSLGAGEHYCLGNALAKLQLRCLLIELTEASITFEVSGKVVPINSIAVNGPAILPLSITDSVT